MNFRKLLIVVSLLFNVLFVVFLAVIFISAGNMSAITFFSLDTDYLHSAFLVSVPVEGADLIFGPVEFALKTGAEAAMQFSTIRSGRQLNLAIEVLYDHSVVSIEPSPFGVVIRGINAGETVLQVFSSAHGFRNIARIFVYE